MDPINAAIQSFQQAYRIFQAEEQQHLFHVKAGSEHMEMVAKLLRAEEWQPGNLHPMLIFPTAYREEEETLFQMKLLLREHYNVLKKAFAEQGKPIPDFPLENQRQKARTEEPVASLLNEVKTFAQCTAPHLKEPIFCWCATEVGDPKAWSQLLAKLQQGLWPQKVTMVIAADPAHSLEETFHIKPDEKAEHTFTIDEEASNAYFSKLMGPPSAGRAKGTLPGCAAPDVAPPPRPGPPEPDDAQIKATAQAEGLPPMLSTRQAETLRSLTLSAAQASAKNDARRTITLQKEACALCREAGVVLEEALMTMVLANYYLQFEMERDAEKAYQAADEKACCAVAFPQIAQIRLALGYLYLKQKRYADAAAIYEQAAVAAVVVGNFLLYCEALRLAGTAHLQLNDAASAKDCWQAPVVQAARASDAERRLSSFRDVAGALIDLLHSNGMTQQAQSVQQMVSQIEEDAAEASNTSASEATS